MLLSAAQVFLIFKKNPRKSRVQGFVRVTGNPPCHQPLCRRAL